MSSKIFEDLTVARGIQVWLAPCYGNIWKIIIKFLFSTL